jgi:hypothetical protein
LWFDIATLDNPYFFGGKFSIFSKFFVKDLLHTISSPSSLLYYFYDTAMLCVSFLLTYVGFYVIYDLLWPTNIDMGVLRPKLIRFWCLWLVLRIWSFWKKKNMVNLLLIYAWTILVYRLFIQFLITNFALTI